ncbi:hypothetical protein LTR50_006564 [Elasticomyces elasticus]|nr:hypothetical protein LTR50_006564 [Elasticomyces elasticus]
MADSLSSPGSSTYSGTTMHVGDGTWDASKDTFLLPNLVGLNFATMRLNGMGNRFAALPQYYRLILGHGVIAALTFLLIVPSAILIARFYHRNGRLALRLHIYLQILTIGLVTVILVLGWFAVGPERSLTNPHHGIGVAIYVLVLVQAIGGALIHHIEKGKERWKVPLKLVIHQWLGRIIALLGIAQIALGLTLYGSPKVLFILFALAAFLIFLLYFILEHAYRPRLPNDDDDDSYISGRTRTDVTEDRRSRHGGHELRNTAIAGGALAGLAALRSRSKSRRREELASRRRPERSDYAGTASRVSSRHHSGSFVEDEKYKGNSKDNTWRDRLLGAAAGVGLLSLFNRRKEHSKGRDSDAGNYRPPLGGHQQITQTDLNRVEAGQAPMSPENRRYQDRPPANTENRRFQGGAASTQMGSPSRRPASRPRRSGGSFSSGYDSYSSDDEDGSPYQERTEKGHGLRNTVATLGVVAGLRQWRSRRRESKEQRRIDEERRIEMENAERINRANSRRQQQRESRNGGENLHRSDTVATGVTNDLGMIGSNPELSRQNFRMSNANIPPIPTTSAANFPPTGPAGSRIDMGYNPAGGVAPPPNTTLYPPTTIYPPPNLPQQYQPPPLNSLTMPPGAVNPDPQRLLENNPPPPASFSQNTAAAGTAAGFVAAGASHSPSRYHSHERKSSRNRSNTRPPGALETQRRRNSIQSATFSSNSNENSGSVTSPPVSVKVRMHNDGRHVTLRRLNEEEAAAEREARRRERRNRKRRTEGLGSDVESGNEGPRHRNTSGAAGPSAQQPVANNPRPPPMQAQNAPLPFPANPSLQQLRGPPLGPPPPQQQQQQQQVFAGLPPPPAGPPPAPTHSASPQGHGIGMTPSGITSMGSGTEVSAFDNNRRRRRAERAQRLAEARGNRVEFT